ncbi:ADP-ribosylglycohydrolase family protein [Arhodomonas sp. SL1]|uniref:ADP-ribosylglycohydrolase family protein n=1 Tax=Arhodomonas sp. SL1 TaxID=3425691 RepID=UPI003F8847B3
MIVGETFSGCLIGGAIGDALGAPVEFLSADQINARYGREGVRDFEPAYGRSGAITDDTQMTLFTADGLLRWTLARYRGAQDARPADYVARAYGRWLATQNGGRIPAWAADEPPGWLYSQDALHSRRAPGNTCLSALRQMAQASDRADNDSKGCGGVMRVAPVGLLAATHGPDAAPFAFELGCEVAAITHGHISGQLPAGVLAAMITRLVHGDDMLEAWRVARGLLVAEPGHEETLSLLDRAVRLARRNPDRRKALVTLGEGWVAEEALAIALYCALSRDDFEAAVTLAVSHGGDSDSTGAICGNLRGAERGRRGIPDHWWGAENLELWTTLLITAVELRRLTGLDDSAYQEIAELFPLE